MKLYSEEQVRKAYKDGNIDGINHIIDIDDCFKYLTPIELPTDEDIKKETDGFMFHKNKELFINGAKWMKEQLIK